MTLLDNIGGESSQHLVPSSACKLVLSKSGHTGVINGLRLSYAALR